MASNSRLLLLLVLIYFVRRWQLFDHLHTIVISPREQAMVGHCLIPVEEVASPFLVWLVIDEVAKQGQQPAKTIADDFVPFAPL